MIEAVAAILGLFCAAIFVAHAIDAYLALSVQGFDAGRQRSEPPNTAWSHS